MASYGKGRRAIAVGTRGCIAALLASASGMAAAQNTSVPIPAPREAIDGNGVRLADGNLALSTTDLEIGNGQSVMAHTRRFVNSGWRHAFEAAVSTTGTGASTVYYVTIGGDTSSFTNAFASREGDGTRLSYNGSTRVYTFTGRDGTVTTFDAKLIRGTGNDEQSASYYGKVAAVATQMARPDGTIYTLTYRSSSYRIAMYSDKRGDYYVTAYVVRLQSVTNNLGFQLKYGYAVDGTTDSDVGANDEWYRITKVTAINNAFDYCDPAADSCGTLSQNPQSVTYSRNGDGTPGETVTDALSRSTQYTTDAYGRITRVKPPRAYGRSYGYDGNGRIGSVNDGAGTTTYAWSPNGGTMTATITDPLQHQQQVDTDVALGVITRQQDAVGRTATFGYDAYGLGQLTHVTGPTGVQVDYARDARGNVTQTTVTPVAKANQVTPAAIVTQAAFDGSCSNAVTCNQPNTTTDARGYVTNYSYDPTHGGMTRVVRPASPAGTRPEVLHLPVAVGVLPQRGRRARRGGAGLPADGQLDVPQRQRLRRKRERGARHDRLRRRGPAQQPVRHERIDRGRGRQPNRDEQLRLRCTRQPDKRRRAAGGERGYQPHALRCGTAGERGGGS